MRGGRLGAVSVMLAMAATQSACGVTVEPEQPHAWSLTFPAANGLDALPVTVTDQSGLVTAAAVDPGFGSWQFGLQPITNRPDALIVGWLGGMCDRRVSVLVGHAARWVIDIAVQEADTCRLGGITRSVALSASVPIDLADVDLTIDGRPVRP